MTQPMKPPLTWPRPYDARTVECRSCRARIYFVRTPAGRLMPCDEDTGVSHFATCPMGHKHRKERKSS